MTAGGAASFYGSAALIRPVRREDRGAQGLRLRLAAGCAIVFALACVLTASDGGARWREKADMMLAARTAYRTTAGTADISAALQRLPAGRTTALDEAAADPAAPEDGAAADSPAAGDGATADTAAQEDAGAASAENATEGSGGCPPMDGGNTWGTSFECWLASYEDPEDVEDWVQAHRASHKFSSAQWYQDHKNASSYGGVDTDEWYAAARRPGSVAGLHFEPWYSARKSFGNFSWPSWVDEHGLKAEYMAHSRLDILAELSSQLDGYSKAKERCGLECWMAQFRHRSQLAAVHRWFKSHRGDKLQALRALEMQVQKLQFQKWYQEHKDFGGPMMNTETWYESEKNTTAGLNFDDWYREHKDFGGPLMNTETWYESEKNTTAGLNFDDWYREHKDFGGPLMNTETWYESEKNTTAGLNFDDWYREHKDFGGPEMDTEVWYANHRLGPNGTSLFKGKQVQMLRLQSLWRQTLYKRFAEHLQKLQFQKWYQEHKDFGGPMMNTETWYESEKNTTAGLNFDDWYREHKDFGGPLMNTETWYESEKNTTAGLNFDDWYREHKDFGGPLMNTETWYESEKNTTAGLNFDDWYREHKDFGGPEMDTEVWYANHRLGPNGTSLFKGKQVQMLRLQSLWRQTLYKRFAEHLQKLQFQKWYQEHKDFGGPMMNTETWYESEKNTTAGLNFDDWYREHKDFGGPLMNTETWYESEKNTTAGLNFDDWYREHKDFGGPLMNTETWYESEKNTTAGLNFDDWYREHKDFGGPEMDTEVWYANHRLGPNGTSLFKQADIVRSVLLWEVVRSIEEHSLLKKLKAASTQAPARVGVAAPVSASQVRQQTLAASTPEHFSLFTWLANEPAAADLLSQANVIKAGTTDKGKMTQDVSDYLDSKTSLDLDTWLAKETGTEEGEEEVEGTIATNPEVKQKKTANVLGKWMNRHISPKLGRWLESFTRTSSPFRAAANSRLAKNALEKDVASLHMDALHSRLAGQRRVQSLQTATAANESGDANSPDFDFETWWAALGSNQPGVAGSNWTKLTPEADSAEISASDTVGSGSCCCGFACEQISNECCGAWYPANGESYMHYGSFKQNPRSIAALSARANAARLQQRSASAQVSMLQQLSAHAPGQELPSLLARAAVTEGEAAVDADAAQRADAALRRDNALKTVKARLSTLLQVAQPKNAKAAVVAAAPKATKASTLREMKMAHAAPKPVTTQVHQAYGDKGFLGWMCAADTCIAAPVRVGASCEVEALSADGVSPLSASGGCMTEAARASDKSKAVQCGAKMAKASGSTGYDDPSHWCHCAAKTLASQIKSCRGGAADEGGGTRGAVFANGLTFGPNVAFADGDTFGDSEVFGEGDSFGSMDKFGSKNKFAKRTKFGMDDKFGDGNEFGEGSVFGRGAKLGDGNKIGAHVEFHGDVVLGAQNDVGRGSSFGRHAKIGRGTILSRHTELASDANLGDKTVVGDGSSIGTGAVIGAKVQIGKRVTLEGVARMGPGTEIGQGSSFDVGTSTLHTTAEPPATAGGAKTAEALEAGAGADEGGKEEADGATSAEDGSEKAEGEEGEEGDETEYYRPDPGSPFAREGSPLMTMRLDGHNHWPVYLPWENEEAAGEGDAEGEGEEGGEDSGSGSAE